MTPHDHRTFVPGCFRCELSRDEARPSAPKRPPGGIAWPVKLNDYTCQGFDADGAYITFDDVLAEGDQVADYRDEDGNHYGPMHTVEQRKDGLWVV